MLALTSISPTHRHGTAHQMACVKSWIKAGYKVASLNKPQECESLQYVFKDVLFVPTYRHHEAMMGRPYVLISALLDYAKETGEEHVLLVNSDIEIEDAHGVADRLKKASEEGVIYLHRHNYATDKTNSAIYLEGMDGFFIQKKWLDIFPQSLMCMGQCFWDYWMPFKAARTQGCKLLRLNDAYLYHKNHPIQYSMKDWEYFGEIARVENKLFNIQRADKIAHVMRREINHNTIAL